MPPIKIQLDSPISTTAAQKPSGVTPQTIPSDHSAPPPASTTSDSVAASKYAPAQPGAPAVPGPTGAAYRQAPPQVAPTPTRTTELASQDYMPPAPQPGAVPQPGSVQPKSGLPPPPKAGQSQPQPAQQPLPAQPPAPVITAPPQLSVPPPQTNAAPTASTTSYLPPQTSFAQPQPPATLNSQPSFSHPPGYVQDPRASEMNASQRAYQQQQVESEGIFSNFGVTGNNSTGGQAGAGPGVLGGAGPSNTGEVGEAVANAWNTAKQWIGNAATKLEGVENEVWKRVNNDK